jgi:hypothetical protein
MTSLELQTESLTVLPQRLETIHMSDPPGSSQRMSVFQGNFNNTRGGHCDLNLVGCTQSNSQGNYLTSQTVPSPAGTGASSTGTGASSTGTGAADIFRGLLGGRC